MTYRITITNADPAVQVQDLASLSVIQFTCTIETDASGAWLLLQDAPATIEIKTSNVLGVLRRDISEAEQRQELLSLIRAHTRTLPLLIAQYAIDRLELLLPAGWPVTINL